MRVVDLFAGIGWSEGIAPLGIRDVGATALLEAS